MVICKDLDSIQHFNNSVLTIGSFDGIHRGHARIISDLKAMSEVNNIPSVVITFDPLPMTVLRSIGPSQRLLISPEKKIDYLNKQDIDYVLVIPFDKPFSKITAAEFLKVYILKYFNPMDIIIGYDATFGYNRKGNKKFLINNMKEYGYNIHVKDPILYLDAPISSTRIRSYIDNGNINEANTCLGSKYSISGIVVRGEGIGSQLGFPTANIKPHVPNLLFPTHGAYCVDAIIEDNSYVGMCNIGRRPTFYDDGKAIIEVHLFSKEPLNLYDKNITIKFKQFLRKEKKYNSITKLTNQLKLDSKACVAL